MEGLSGCRDFRATIQDFFPRFLQGTHSALSKFTIVILEPSVQDDRSTTFNGAFVRIWFSERNEPHLCRRRIIFNLSGHLTCLTVPVYVARFTRALVASSNILTSSTVLTRGLSTFIDI